MKTPKELTFLDFVREQTKRYNIKIPKYTEELIKILQEGKYTISMSSRSCGKSYIQRYWNEYIISLKIEERYRIKRHKMKPRKRKGIK